MVASGIAGNILHQIQASVGAPSQSGLNGWLRASKKDMFIGLLLGHLLLSLPLTY